MNAKLFGELAIVTCAALGAAACSVNTAKTTSWGKEGVSMIDYQTDGILCATLSERVNSGDATHTAGGLDGKNDVARQGGAGDAAVAAGNNGGGQSSSNAPSLGGGTYSGTASTDMVSRAASQQRTQEMRLKQARMDALKSCLVGRGYKEFELSPEQRAELAKLPQGSDQRREYLYKLGTDPKNLKSTASAK
jgi:hypothetical protein